MGKKRFERDKKYEGWLSAHLDMDLRERGLRQIVSDPTP
jgi:hypothetical protein